MKIKYNQAVDLSCAMMQYAHWAQLTGPKVPGYTVSSELERWYSEVKSGISSLLEHDLNYLIRNFLGLTFFPVELCLLNGYQSGPELISAIRDYPAEQMPARLYSGYNIETAFDDIKDDPELLKKTIEMAGGTTRKKEAELFCDFVRTPAAFRNRLADMLEQFFVLAVEPFRDLFLPAVTEQIEQDQKVLDSEPERFFSDYCRINLLNEEVVPGILMSFFSEIDIIQIDDPPVIIYGRSRSRLQETAEIPTEQIYSLFSDESRRRILQLLCRKPWFIRELADELGITSATVSYHMNRLSSMDLVTYEQGSRKRLYYRADRMKVKAMLRTVETDILGT